MKITSKFQCSLRVCFIYLVMSLELSAEELNIGTVDVSPRGYVSNNVVKGSSYDIVNAIASEAGYSYSHKLLPYARIIPYLDDGTIDLALLVLNDTTNDVATPIAHIQNTEFVLLGASGGDIKGLDDLAGKKVAYLRRSANVRQLIENIPVSVTQADNYESLINLLLANRVDAIIGPKINIYWNLKEQNLRAQDVGDPILVKEIKIYLVHSKETITDERRVKLEEAIKKLQANGTIREIIKNYDYSIK